MAAPTKKATAEFETRIREWVELYAPILGLSHIFIEIEFSNRCNSKDDKGFTCHAHYFSSHPYRKGKIRVHSSLMNVTLAEQERAIIHELAHAVVEPLNHLLWLQANDKLVPWREAEDRREEVTDHIAQVIWEMVGGEGR